MMLRLLIYAGNNYVVERDFDRVFSRPLLPEPGRDKLTPVL